MDEIDLSVTTSSRNIDLMVTEFQWNSLNGDWMGYS